MVQWHKKNQKISNWKNYLPPRLAYLNVFSEKKPKDHYFKHYDLSIACIVVSKLENFNNIIGVLLYDAIPCTDLKDLSKEVAWLDLNVNECKRGPKMGSYKMNMFGWKRNVLKKMNLQMAGMYHRTFALIYVQSSFNAYMLT
jgi:hypothetical protein